MIKVLTVCATATLLVACSTSNHPSAATSSSLVASSASPVPPAATFSTAVPAGVDNACEHATPSAQQLTGDWTDSGEVVSTLGGDYTLKSSNGRTGVWSYMPWSSTPGKNSMPAGEENQCVLWLHWQSQSPMDLLYVPLKATPDSLELSYVGRGNTLHWTRPSA